MSQEFFFTKVDNDKRKKGAWVGHPSGKFLIGSPNQLEVTKKQEELIGIIKKKHSSKDDPKGNKYQLQASELYEVNMRVVATLKILDWELLGDDAPKYTVKAGVEALNSDREYTLELKKEQGIDDEDVDPEGYIPFLSWVNKESNKFSNYDLAKREEDVKK